MRRTRRRRRAGVRRRDPGSRFHQGNYSRPGASRPIPPALPALFSPPPYPHAVVTLRTRIRPVDQPDGETRDVAEGADYSAARAELDAQVSAGWQMLGIRRWP